MANFLFCSLDAALIGDVAWQVFREGHDVRYYIEAESDQGIADGFVPKTDDWRAELDWADVIIFDDIWISGDDRGESPGTDDHGDATGVGSDVGTGELAQALRADGHAVVGGTPATDRLEDERGYAMDVLEANGVNTVEHHVFHDFQAGIDHVEANPAPYVIKPLGEVQNVKRLLYVGREDDGSDVVDVLAVVFETDDRTGIHIEDAKCVAVGDAASGPGQPCDPRDNDDGQWRVAGESGMALVVTGKGETMAAAREQAYDRVDDIVIPNLYYRDDIGERWIDGDGDRLQAWGYLGP